MSQKRSILMLSGVIGLIIVNLFGWGYVNYQISLQGNLSDEFVVHWVAARALMIDGDSPYDAEVGRKILTVMDNDSMSTIGHASQFTSPIYALFLLFPFAMISDIIIAQTLWMSLAQLLLVLIILVSLKLGNAKPSRMVFMTLILGTFLGYHSLNAIWQGNTFILSCLFILISVWLIRSGRDEFGGIFLGFASIQLPFILLPTILILLWTIRNRRFLVSLWFFGVVIMLTVIGIFLVRDWPLQYMKIITNFTLFFPASSLGSAFRVWWPGIGKLLSWVLTILSIILLLFEWWATARRGIYGLIWTLCLTLVLGFLIGLPVLPESLVLLVFPLIICVGAWSERWGKTGNVLAIVSICIIFVWEWLVVFGNLNNTRSFDNLDILIPMPVICLIGLYWIRWTVIRPKRLLIEDLQSFENV